MKSARVMMLGIVIAVFLDTPGLVCFGDESSKMNTSVGGQERFRLGPEGGQFALFFKPGTKFEFSDWATPAPIDTEPFELVEQTQSEAEFSRDCELTNYSGTKFKMGRRSYDEGILRFKVNGQPAGAETDLYAPKPTTSGRIELGLFEPVNGVFTVCAEVVGKNTKSSGTYFGLDCIVIDSSSD